MSEEEARRVAEAEGLTLVRSNNITGFKGVGCNPNTQGRYQAHMRQDGKQVCLGSYGNPVQAALAYARQLGPMGSAAAATAAGQEQGDQMVVILDAKPVSCG